jgi:hypothetical protein
MPDRTKVLAFNGNTTRRDDIRDWINRIDPDVCLICETGGLNTLYKGMGKYHHPPRSTPPDPSVLVRKPGDQQVRFTSGQLTQYVRYSADKPMMWHDRYYVRARVGRTANYSTHGNAIIHDNGKWRDNEGARRWKAGLTKLGGLIRRDRNNGLAVRVGGDFNFPRSPVPRSPNNFFDGLGLNFFCHGLMWIAWDPRKERLVDSRELGKAPGADAHHALVVVLEAR